MATHRHTPPTTASEPRPHTEGEARRIEQEAAEALLGVGLSIPICEARLPWSRKRIRWRATMHRPTLATTMRICRLSLAMGVTSGEMERYSKEEQLRFIATHGATISRIVALTIARSPITVWWWAWVVRHVMSHRMMMHAFATFVRLLGTRAFINIIRSAEMANPMAARLSQEQKGS